MILFKNYEGQVVYTTITDLLTGLPIENDTVTAYISKDGSQFVPTTNSVNEITDAGGNGYGVYSVNLTATETNCDTGVVIFTSTLIELSTDLISAKADTVYFQTSSTTPSVSIADGTYGFNTSGYVGYVSGHIGGNISGNLNGNVSGFVSGNVKGNVEGVVGGVYGNITAPIVSITDGAGGGYLEADLIKIDNINPFNNANINISHTIYDRLSITNAFEVNNISGYAGPNTTVTGNIAGNLNGNVSGFVSGAVKGNVEGNVNGSVGSVVGAVGSVTGNVGGNVVGSVASVTAPVTVGTNNDKTGYTASTVSDKTGYSLSSSQTFNTTGSVGSVTGNVDGNVTGSVGSVSSATSIITAIKSASYDGITQEKLYEVILAFMANKVTITSAGSGLQTISYKKRDGSTEVLSVTVSTTDGSRASGGTIT